MPYIRWFLLLQNKNPNTAFTKKYKNKNPNTTIKEKMAYKM